MDGMGRERRGESEKNTGAREPPLPRERIERHTADDFRADEATILCSIQQRTTKGPEEKNHFQINRSDVVRRTRIKINTYAGDETKK